MAVMKKTVTPTIPEPIKELPKQNQAKTPIDSGVPTVDPNTGVATDGKEYSKLKNPNQSLTRFGDDSSADQYANNLWGQGQKYTGEGVKTSDMAYDPNVTTKDLDPNYKYWRQAQLYGSEHDGYISQRNDMIASALYNEGKTSREDVRSFLEGQKWFFDSTEWERNNTIESVWKRLGTYPVKGEAEKPEENKELTNMEWKNVNELGEKDEAGRLYGKDTPQKGDATKGIVTEVDPNSIQNHMIETRQAKVKALQTMDSKDIATSIYYGTTPYWSQTLRDLSEVDPNKYFEIQNELNYLKKWDDINNIASWGAINGKSETEIATENANNDANQWLDENTNERTKDEVKSDLQLKMESNQVAKSATEEMNNVNKLIAEYQEKLDNLPNEAKKAFKNDVPQYLYDAYIANRTQAYQSEINKLQSRYNSAIELYKTELANTQWGMEYDLKLKNANADINYKNAQLKLQENAQTFDQNYKTAQLSLDQQKINLSRVHWDGWKAWYLNDDGTVTQLTEPTIYNEIAKTTQQYLSAFEDGDDGKQCEVFTDKFTEALYWITMDPVDVKTWEISWTGATTALQKRWYVNTVAELPTVGTVAVFDFTWMKWFSPYQQKWWHTMVIESWDPNTGLLTLKGSNKDGKEKVYTETHTISEWKKKWLVWYWDPMKDQRLQWANSSSNGMSYGNTPMLGTFDALWQGDLNADQKKDLKLAEWFYNMMYSMKETWLIDAMLTSDEFKKVIADIQKADFSKSWEDQWSAFFEVLSESIKNNIKGEDIGNAVNRFQVMVKNLLRAESGAAINSWEWRNYFKMYIPSASDTWNMSLDKLYLWDDTIYDKLRGTGNLKQEDYVPLFRDWAYQPKSTVSGERKNPRG